MLIEIPVITYTSDIKGNNTKKTIVETIVDISKFKMYKGEDNKLLLQNLEYNDYEIETDIFYDDFKKMLLNWCNLTNRGFLSIIDMVKF